MSNPGYTEDDIRREAARYAGGDWDGLEVTVGMAERPPWEGLPAEQFNEAFGKVVKMAANAADLSEWAVGLGADGFEPTSRHVDISFDGWVCARVHLAFSADVPDRLRLAIVNTIRSVAAEVN